MENQLKEILAIGNQILDALASDDLELFYTLIDQRETLVKDFKKPDSSSGPSQLHVAYIQSLEEQYAQIVEVINQKERKLMQQLNHLNNLKKADNTYGNRKRRQLIQGKLLG